MNRGEDAGGSGAGGGDPPTDQDGSAAESPPEVSSQTSPGTQHVRVRRASPPQSVFGQTPISGPARARAEVEAEEEVEEETGPQIAMWIRRAALVAALRSGAGSCGAGIFMGLCLGCFLPGDTAILLALLMVVLSVPVGIFAGFSTYRQTVESERLRQGLCPHCGYDLRGINTERCPECGTRLRLPKPWLAADTERHGEQEGMD